MRHLRHFRETLCGAKLGQVAGASWVVGKKGAPAPSYGRHGAVFGGRTSGWSLSSTSLSPLALETRAELRKGPSAYVSISTVVRR